MLARLLACAALVAVATAQTTAQTTAPATLPGWARLDLPQGVGANAVDGQGKLLTHRDGARLDVYSAATRRWHRATVAVGAPLWLFNDCLVVLEPTRCVAFGALDGEFRALPVSVNAALLNGSGKNDSIVLVADGGAVHAFSGFVGAWTTRAVGAGFSASVQRHTALLADGVTLAGMSAFDGVWRETTTAQPVTWTSADGTAALASDGATLYGFSAHGGGFRTAAAPANATFVRGDDWGLWHGGGAVVAFSGLRDAFVSHAATVSGLHAVNDLFALLSTPAGALAFSAVTGDFAATALQPAAVELGEAGAVLLDAQGAHGYSPLRQAFAALPGAASAARAAGCVGYVEHAATGELHAWSSMTARWHRAPPDALAATKELTTTAIGFATPTSTYAFEPTRGGFVALPSPALGLRGNSSSARLLAYDAQQLHAFDARSARWRSRPRTGAGQPTFRSWRTASVVLDGEVAHGVGALSGRWHALDLGAAATTASPSANSEVGFVVLADAVAACTMLPELLPLGQFPHFRRVQPRGAAVSWSLSLPDRMLGVALFGAAAPPRDLPGFGAFWLDHTHAAVAAPPNGRVAWTLPDDPALQGAVLAGQALMLTPSGALALGDLATVMIW